MGFRGKPPAAPSRSLLTEDQQLDDFGGFYDGLGVDRRDLNNHIRSGRSDTGRRVRDVLDRRK